MSLNPALQFDETSLTAAEFDPQDKVLPNSPAASNDINAIASRALRRAAYLRDIKVDKAGDSIQGNLTLDSPAEIDFDADRSYRQPVHITFIDFNFWGLDVTNPASWPHTVQQTALTNPANYNEHISYETDVPPGGSCVKAEVWVTPIGGHGGLPANRPNIDVWLYDSDTGVPSLLASASANAGTLVAYEARTLLTATAIANTLAVPQKIIVRVRGEFGANSLVGLVVDEPTVTFSTPQMNFP